MLASTRPPHPELDRGETLALALLGWTACLLVVVGLGFLAGLSIGPWQAPLAVLLTPALVWLALGRPRPAAGRLATPLVLAALWVALCLGLAAWGHDFSYDGQCYHQEGILTLAEGWNPVWAPLAPKYFYPVINYPKGAWKLAASLAAVLGSVEPGKGFGLILALAAGLSLRGFLVRLGLPAGWRRGLLVLVAVAPPALFTQAGTYYLDSQLYACLVILAVGLLDFLLWGPSRRVWLWGLANLIMLDLKFTGPVYSVFLTAPVFLWLVWRRRDLLQPWLGVVVLSGFLGVVVCGANPYVTNLIHFGHPMYPVNQENVARYQAPPEFIAKNRVAKLAWSLASRSSARMRDMPQLKPPLTLDWGEVQNLGSTSLRYGGFGPLFSGVLLLLAPAVWLVWRGSRRRFWWGLGLSGLVLAMTLMVPEPWYARFVPQVWTWPLIWLALLLLTPGGWPRRLAAVMLVLLGVNQALFLGANLTVRVAEEAAFREQVAEMRQAAGDGPLAVVAPWLSVAHRLAAQGLTVVRVESLDCPVPERIVGGQAIAFWCPAQPHPAPGQATLPLTALSQAAAAPEAPTQP